MGRKKDNMFNLSAIDNKRSYIHYINRLTELAVSMFEWKNLPASVDQRYIETQLFTNPSVVYFDDEEMGNLCLNCVPTGQYDVYGNPTSRRAYSRYNHYSKELDITNSVIIWNNYLRINTYNDVQLFAKRLWSLDRIMDINANAQKTPILVQGTEQQKLTLMNLYKEYDGNQPFIFGNKNIDTNTLKVLTTNAPYIADRIHSLKMLIWNEALTFLGISNTNIQKKERLTTDEVSLNQGGTVASRYSRLESRREAAEKINRMFGTNIEVNYREDFQQVDISLDEETGSDTTGGDGNE